MHHRKRAGTLTVLLLLDILAGALAPPGRGTDAACEGAGSGATTRLDGVRTGGCGVTGAGCVEVDGWWKTGAGRVGTGG